ncbi:MAG: rhodanese-like domain-containing protein [Kiritimatiellia bacterium]|jgi:phage shock protein E|nr:rhodanese-like domain-containing protein [Kiritimatiellia bacterium]MDP6630444.1 rhodanese-like domain-containing protein [Kiritimatiellia bacterium]MDP6809901.1 rhodanese-like domain-containing protein [Kiritimatiellia bacterium]MDP7024293.1 rhodanese-like domain-containing protein [Kiritimatiellia bacterium]
MKNWIWIIIAVGAVLVLKNLLMGRASKGDIQAKLEQGALVVDVRTPAEFSGGHYEGAINLPLSTLATQLDKLDSDKSRPIILYCHSGARSASAKRTLEQAGYTNVLNAGSLRHMP